VNDAGGSQIFDALVSGKVESIQVAVSAARDAASTRPKEKPNWGRIGGTHVAGGVVNSETFVEDGATSEPAKAAGRCCLELVEKWECENFWLSYRNLQGLSPVELAVQIGHGQGLDVLHQMSPTPVWHGQPRSEVVVDQQLYDADCGGHVGSRQDDGGDGGDDDDSTFLGARFDAVVIPSGGIDDEGNPREWVVTRLDAALEFDAVTKYYVCLSRATFHKPPCTADDGYPVDEATSSANYLIGKGVNSSRILLEGWSLDTIGNAYGARQLICEPMRLRRLLIITSEFHMRRTRLLFDWIFSLPTVEGGVSNFHVRYLSVPNNHLTEEEVSARVAREERSASVLVEQRINMLRNLSQVARFVFLDHKAYMAKRPRNGTFSLSDQAKVSY